jgi:hypothetical protein
VLARLSVNELGDDANLIGLLSDASFQCVADIKVAADLARINRLAFVDKGRITGDYGEIGKTRQHGDDVVTHTIAQVAEALIWAQVIER